MLPETVEKARKAAVLDADQAAQAESDAIRQVSATYADARQRVLIANSDGLLVEDDRVRTRIGVHCVAVGDTGMQTGYEAPGRTSGSRSSTRSTRRGRSGGGAPRHHHARCPPAAAGKLPVVSRQGAGGVLFHEACGHGLEADLVEKGTVVFRERVGEQVASPLVTLVDDGTYARVGHPRDR